MVIHFNLLKSSSGTLVYPVIDSADSVCFMLEGTLGFSLCTLTSFSGFCAGLTQALLRTSMAATGFSYTILEVDIV